MCGGEYLADNNVLGLAFSGHRTGVTILKILQYLKNLLSLLERNLAALGSKSLAHLNTKQPLLRILIKLRSINELYPPTPLWCLSIREYPHIGGNAGVIEQLFGQRDHCFQPVVFKNPPTDFALP